MSEKPKYTFPPGPYELASFFIPFSDIRDLPPNPSEEVAQRYIDERLHFARQKEGVAGDGPLGGNEVVV